MSSHNQYMAGLSADYVYTADDTTAYKVRMPVWEANFSNHAATLTQAATSATTQPDLPRGVRRRKRYYRITATGREGSITVLDSASNIWTSAPGTPCLIPLFNAALAGADNGTLEGRTGERTKAI
jgi:hypothetical protein